MITCIKCTHQNVEGAIYCDNCGTPLREALKRRSYTRKLGTAGGGSGLLQSANTWGTARLTEDSRVVIHISDAQETVPVDLERKSIIGREDLSSDNHPDIDLVPFGALEKGVSRIHAALERREDTLTLIDMGSSNGTFLNGQRLARNQPRVLRDGDEIRFGN